MELTTWKDVREMAATIGASVVPVGNCSLAVRVSFRDGSQRTYDHPGDALEHLENILCDRGDNVDI